MSKKKFKVGAAPEPATDTPAGEARYAVQNLTQNVLSVPYYTPEGVVAYLHVRVQGRRSEAPPVIPAYAITEQLRVLEKKQFIKLVKVQ